MLRDTSGTLRWDADRDELWEAAGAVWRHRSGADERELHEAMIDGLADIDPPRMSYPQLDGEQLELLAEILDVECDDVIYGQSFPYHPLNNVRRDVRSYLNSRGNS